MHPPACDSCVLRAQIIVVEGGINFLSLYQGLITIRILLSWFPQAQGVALLQPIFTASDVYLNLFRGIVPPIGGIDISPIGAVRAHTELALPTHPHARARARTHTHTHRKTRRRRSTPALPPPRVCGSSSFSTC